MDALGAGELEVDVDVYPRRDLRNVLAVVVVIGDRRPPVAVNGEPRQQRVQFAQQRVALVVSTGGVLRATDFNRRARRIDYGLGTVDVDLRLGIVGLVVLRAGPEEVFT